MLVPVSIGTVVIYFAVMVQRWFASFCLVLLTGCVIPHGSEALRMERIVVAPDARGFRTAESQQAFHPWGFNYGNQGRLMEDFWNDDWQTFAGDFREMKALGANVVRVHLQYGKFMSAPGQ